MKNNNIILLEALDFKIGFIEDCFKYPHTLEDDFEFDTLDEKIEYWRYKYLQYIDAREQIKKMIDETT